MYIPPSNYWTRYLQADNFKNNLKNNSIKYGITFIDGEEVIDRNNLKLMKKNSVIVNTSRGPIIKEKDLIDALKNDVISCAALDVYDQEPLPRDHILRKTKKLKDAQNNLKRFYFKKAHRSTVEIS